MTDKPKARPRIGDKAMFYLRDEIKALGTIMDIRRNDANERFAAIAVLGWPHMNYVTTAKFHEQRDGVWRACTHPNGFDAVGNCFDCRDDWRLDND